jgi:DNA-directed RNA polymerase subunit RPC12/RpoP
MTATYICDHCNGRFETDNQDDEKAHAESLALWGKRGDAPDMARVCDECFKKIMAWVKRTDVVQS